MPESPAGHHGNEHPHRSRQRCQNEGDFVPHTTGRVFVDPSTGQIAQVEDLTGVEHRSDQGRRLTPFEPSETHGHQKRRHLIVRNVTPEIGLKECFEVGAGYGPAFPLPLDYLGRYHAPAGRWVSVGALDALSSRCCFALRAPLRRPWS